MSSVKCFYSRSTSNALKARRIMSSVNSIFYSKPPVCHWQALGSRLSSLWCIFIIHSSWIHSVVKSVTICCWDFREWGHYMIILVNWHNVASMSGRLISSLSRCSWTWRTLKRDNKRRAVYPFMVRIECWRSGASLRASPESLWYVVSWLAYLPITLPWGCRLKDWLCKKWIVRRDGTASDWRAVE